MSTPDEPSVELCADEQQQIDRATENLVQHFTEALTGAVASPTVGAAR